MDGTAGRLINIGIGEADREAIAGGLSRLLADTYLLYLKTHNFHWNVEGPLFNTLHSMFEEQYTELAVAVDDIAERIRALGVAAPGSFIQYRENAEVKEEQGVPVAEDMVAQLMSDQETVVRTARNVLPLAQSAGDEPTADLLTQRMLTHEKVAWMLRSMIS